MKNRGHLSLSRSIRLRINFLAIAWGVCLFAQSASAQPASPTQYWTDQDGHHYDASIVSLFNDEVTFKHPDGRTFTLALSDLVPNDREAVRTWLLRQPRGSGEEPPPTQTLSPYGRRFVLDQPRVLRLRPLQDHGYLSAYLGIPLTIRNVPGSNLDFVNVYFYDDQRKRIPFPLPPPGSPLMIQDGKTTAFIKPADLKPGQTYMVLIPIRDPSVRLATYDLVVAGNSVQTVTTVFPDGSWRDFDFPERAIVSTDKYADYASQELYPGKAPIDLFNIEDVVRLQPATGDHSPEHDYFRLSVRIQQPFPASALSACWYAFDQNHKLIHVENTPPYAQAKRKDGMFIISQPGSGQAELNDAITPTESSAFDTVQLPGAAWWDKPEVDALVFVFGTETKKVVRVYSKSGATLAQLPVPEKEALGEARPTTLREIAVRQY